jgi:hypothetical protein
LNLFSTLFSAEELLGVTVVELVKKEGSTLGIVISGKSGSLQREGFLIIKLLIARFEISTLYS